MAHVMAQAVKSLFPEAKLGFGPPTEQGFFYDFDFGDYTLTEADLKKIEKSMKKIINFDYYWKWLTSVLVFVDSLNI